MSDQGKPKRRLLSSWDRLWLIIVAIIILYMVLKQFGVDMVYRTEQEELIQHPHRD
ncbi:MAG: hypothetical protein KDD06_02635 [Phaeodactylibacter sp.]|nr:hypothetical protein [Phaeodactylibacter sp.]